MRNGDEGKGKTSSEPPRKEGTVPPRPRSRKLRHREHGTLVASGPSGTVYRFHGYGSTLRVKGEDIEALLALARTQRSCCGAASIRRQQLLVEVSA